MASGHTTFEASDAQDPEALEEGVRALSGSPLAGTPGEAFGYANANYNILGLLVQTVSGQPFGDYADVPAPSTGMPSTTMYSSAEDLGRELTMLLDEGRYGGGRILQPAVSLAMLLAELMSMWLALHFLLRKRRVGLKRWMPLALAVRQNR
jgi:CubicO group peptidase (beta-lactamase class C family)